MKCQINLDIYNPEAPAFWPAAPLRRTSVFAASENLGAGRIHSARACNSHTFRCGYFLEGTVKIDIFPFQGKAPIVWYTDRAPSVNGSRLESSRNVFVLRKGYTNILKR